MFCRILSVAATSIEFVCKVSNNYLIGKFNNYKFANITFYISIFKNRTSTDFRKNISVCRLFCVSKEALRLYVYSAISAKCNQLLESIFARDRITCRERAILLPPARKISSPTGSIFLPSANNPLFPRHAEIVNERTYFKQ